MLSLASVVTGAAALAALALHGCGCSCEKYDPAVIKDSEVSLDKRMKEFNSYLDCAKKDATEGCCVAYEDAEIAHDLGYDGFKDDGER